MKKLDYDFSVEISVLGSPWAQKVILVTVCSYVCVAYVWMDVDVYIARDQINDPIFIKFGTSAYSAYTVSPNIIKLSNFIFKTSPLTPPHTKKNTITK